MARKVVTGFACINEDSDEEIDGEEDAPTFVTHLKKVVYWYNKAMEYLAEENAEYALDVFNELLNYPHSIDVRQSVPPEGDPLHALLNVCQAALKWKGELLLRDNCHPIKAFECYKEAFEIHPNDIVLCKKLGTLALEIGYIGYGRYIIEKGLVQRPDYIPLMEPLIELCLEVQEYEKACEYASCVVKSIPNHQRANELLRIHHQGIELLHPKINYRVDYEPKPCNKIRRFIPSFSWYSFVKTLTEIMDFSNIEDSESGEHGILIWSINSNWEMLCQAKLNYEIVESPTSARMEIDPVDSQTSATDNKTLTQTQKVSNLEEVGTSRFPLRSRISQQRNEESKSWDILESFKTAIGIENWELLISSWQTIPHQEPISNLSEREDFSGLSAFLSKHIGSESVSPLDLAIGLLEWKSKNSIHLTEKEAEILCVLDKLIGFDASPFYHLFMGELLLNAASSTISTSSTEPETIPGFKDERYLQRSQKHIFKCVEYKALPFLDPQSDFTEEFFQDEYLVRLYWALGRIQLLEGRCQEAEKAFQSAMEYAENLKEPLVLHHVMQDEVISVQTIQSKLVMCLYQNIIEGLEADQLEEESKDLHEYKDICNLLIPALFLDKMKQKPPILLSDWRFKGLIYLKEAAKNAEDTETEFLCHLHLVDLCLETANYTDIELCKDRGAFASQIPNLLKESIDCLTKRETFLQILKFVTFIFTKWSESPLAVAQCKLFPLLQREDCQSLIRNLILRGIQHLEWCFWRSQYKENDHEVISSGKRESRKRALHESAAFLFVCIQLDLILGSNAELMENVALYLYDILTEREAVCLKKTTEIRNYLLHLLSLRFSAWIDFFSKVEETKEEALDPIERNLVEINVEERADIKHSVEALIDGVAHFVKCLYGLELVSSNDSPWATKALPVTGSKETLKNSTLSRVWKYLAPCLSYIESKEGDLHVFGKLTEILQQLIGVLEPPSEPIVSALSVSSIFDSDDSQIEKDLSENQLPIILKSNMEQLEAIASQLEHKEVNEEIYYYISLALLDVDVEWGQGERSLLGSQGMDVFEEQVKWLKLDLLFNSDRYWSWECLAITYKQATETLVDTCTRELFPGEFISDLKYSERLQKLCRCQNRCFQIARILATGEAFQDERKYVYEMLSELELFKIIHTPPLNYSFIPRAFLPLTPSEKQAYLSAKIWLEKQLEEGDGGWKVYYQLGKITWKLKGTDWESKTLSYFSKSHELAQSEEGGLLEPFYKLHSTRLKLLLKGSNHWDLLSSYMFHDEELPVKPGNERNALFVDCRLALEFCRLKFGNYHRVYYCLSQAFTVQGNYSGALSFIQQLFVKGKKKFCVAFAPTDPRQAKGLQKGTTNVHYAKHQSQFGASTMKISGLGLGESTWKFASSVRKYLYLYLKLLYWVRDLDLLNIIETVLLKGDFESPKELQTETPGRYRTPCLADMSTRAYGIKLLLLYNGLRRELKGETAVQLNHFIDKVLEFAFKVEMLDSEYSSLSNDIYQTLSQTWMLIQSVTDFDTGLFYGVMELFCEEKCNLLCSHRSIDALQIMLTEFENEAHSPSAVLLELSAYALIYPVLVLKSQDVSLSSRLAIALQQRYSTMKEKLDRRLLKRALFCIVQVIFYRAETIRKKPPLTTLVDPASQDADLGITALTSQVSNMIRYFNDVLQESRFLCLRLMHIMQHLYESICIVYRAEPSMAIQPNLPLKSLVSIWMTTLQKIRAKPPNESDCIDLTQEEEPVMVSTTADTAPNKDSTDKEATKAERISSNEEVKQDDMEIETLEKAEEQTSDQKEGAFANTMQKFIHYKEDDEFGDD